MTDTSKMLFCFGSNESGHHGAGAARTAYRDHGALMGKSYGHYGNSFAIPTKNRKITRSLSLVQIQMYVTGFLAYATGHPELQFQVTRIGCGLAGLLDADIAPMFLDAPSNCLFDTAWAPILGDQFKYWGGF